MRAAMLGLLLLTPAAADAMTITGVTPPTYALGTLASGSPLYVDRLYTTTTVPARVEGAAYLRTANNDKYGTSATAVQFTVDQAVSVLVAYVASAARPAWLASWVDTGMVLGTTDVPLRLYERVYPAGPIALGGNAGAESMYLVLFLPSGPVVYPGRVDVAVTRLDVVSWTLTWMDAAPRNGAQFELERGPAVGGPFTSLVILNEGTTVYEDRAVVKGQRYCWRARERIGVVTSTYSNVACTP